MSTTQNILILGASTRAAAHSAARAGFRARCLDQFADADLAALCPTVRFDPLDLEALCRSFEAVSDGSDWIYTGPLENHPVLIERLQARRRLLGNGPATLRLIRDPWNLAAALARNGLPAPALRPPSAERPTRGRWLAKPTASAGGRSIHRADASFIGIDDPFYYQEFVEGPTFSASYVGAAEHARLLGVVRQFPGASGSPFLYRGGIGPWPVAATTEARLEKLGDVLAAEFALVGLFGVDFVLSEEQPWTVEVNPRYTASVEVLELATRRELLRDHIRACLECRLPEPDQSLSTRVVGKRILYSTRRLVTPAIDPPDWRAEDPFAVPSIADVPWPGTRIEPLEPIMTVLVAASSVEECSLRLDRLEDEWTKRLEQNGAGP